MKCKYFDQVCCCINSLYHIIVLPDKWIPGCCGIFAFVFSLLICSLTLNADSQELTRWFVNLSGIDMRINLVVWWKGRRGLQVHGCQPTCILRRPEITSEFPLPLNPTWTFHLCTALFLSLCLLASSAMQGINCAADVIFYLQHSHSLHKCLLGASLKETSQGWNCAKTHKGCLLPYSFYSIWFLATIAWFWKCTKWQSRTSLLMSCVFYFLQRNWKEQSLMQLHVC